MNSVIEAIITILVSRADYRRIEGPLEVEGIDFKFESVLIGPGLMDDLVIAIDLQAAGAGTVSRRVRGLVTLLDRLKSRRTVSVVVVARYEAVEALEDIRKLCHLIEVAPGESVERSLRPLLPLVLPQPEESRSSSEDALRKECEDILDDPLVQSLVTAAHESSESVARILHNSISEIADSLVERP